MAKVLVVRVRYQRNCALNRALGSSQATSSITGGAVSACAGFRNAIALRSWMTWQASSSSARFADKGNASVRIARSAEAGVRPWLQATSTRNAVSTNSLELIRQLPGLFHHVRPECVFLYMARQSYSSHSSGTVCSPSRTFRAPRPYRRMQLSYAESKCGPSPPTAGANDREHEQPGPHFHRAV